MFEGTVTEHLFHWMARKEAAPERWPERNSASLQTDQLSLENLWLLPVLLWSMMILISLSGQQQLLLILELPPIKSWAESEIGDLQSYLLLRPSNRLLSQIWVWIRIRIWVRVRIGICYFSRLGLTRNSDPIIKSQLEEQQNITSETTTNQSNNKFECEQACESSLLSLGSVYPALTKTCCFKHFFRSFWCSKGTKSNYTPILIRASTYLSQFYSTQSNRALK